MRRLLALAPAPFRKLFWFFRRYGDALGLLGLAASLFAVATNTQTGWLFLFCAFLLAALLLHAWLGYSEMKGAEVSLHSCTPGCPRVGEDSRWVFLIKVPRARFRYPLVLEVPCQDFERKANSRYFSIAASEQMIEVSIVCQRRGLIGDRQVHVSLQSWAPFAWFASRRDLLAAQEEVLVLPTGPPLQAALEPNQGSGRGDASWSKQNGIWGDVRSLREYFPGDDPRWVHWPTSARLGRLIVRERSEQSGRTLRLFFDVWTPDSGDYAVQFEDMVAGAASLLDWGPPRGFAIELWFNSFEGEYRLCGELPLQALARIQPAGVRTVASALPAGSGVALCLSLRGAAPREGALLWDFRQPQAFPGLSALPGQRR